MAFDFAKLKAKVRRTVHKTFGVKAFYKDASISTPVEIKARWHTKVVLSGDLDNQGYAEIIQGVDRVIFEAAVARKLNMKRGGEVFFPDFGAGLGVSLGSPLGGDGITPAVFILQNREKNTGPVEEVWEVTVKETAK